MEQLVAHYAIDSNLLQLHDFPETGTMMHERQSQAQAQPYSVLYCTTMS